MTGALTRLARSASFDRRRRSTTDPVKQDPPPDVHKQDSSSSNSGRGVVAKIARSASFERRRKKKPPTAREGTTSEESSGESSPTSRCVSPDLEESDEPLSKELAGWLLKRHTREKNLGSQWARRYFHVNEIRGTLSMSKGPRKKASAVLPIGDIKSVTMSKSNPQSKGSEDVGYCFVISCPPVHLTVSCEDRAEARKWVHQLRLRVEIWRAKAKDANGVMISRVGAAEEMLPSQECVSVPSESYATGHEDAPARSVSASPGRRELRNEPIYETAAGMHAPPPSRPSLPSPQAPATVERTELETVELLSDEDEDEGEIEAAHAPPQARGTAAGVATPQSSSKILPPPRDLEAMMSSDEEEEEEELEPAPRVAARAPPAAARRPQPEPAAEDCYGGGLRVHGARRKPERIPPEYTAEEAAAAGLGGGAEAAGADAAGADAAAPVEAGGGAGGGLSWLSSLPDTAYDAADSASPEPSREPSAADETVDHSLTARYSPVPARVAAAPRASPQIEEPPPPPPPPANNYDDWDDDEEVAEVAPPPPAALPAAAAEMARPSVGENITADDNFVESDWDDDE